MTNIQSGPSYMPILMWSKQCQLWFKCQSKSPKHVLSQYKQRTTKSRYPLAINIFKFPDDVRLILLKSRFDAHLECQVTVVSKLNFKKQNVCAKSLDFQEKKRCSPAGFEPTTSCQLYYPLSYDNRLWFNTG